MNSLLQTLTMPRFYPARTPLAEEDDIESQSSGLSERLELIHVPAHAPEAAHSVPQSGEGSQVIRANRGELISQSFEGRPVDQQPGRTLLQCCARSSIGKIIGHGMSKGVAVFIPVAAYLVDYQDIGGHHAAAIGIGVSAWALSTVVSLGGRSACRGVTSVVAESVGYGILGLLLGPIDIIEYCIGRGVHDAHMQTLPGGYSVLR